MSPIYKVGDIIKCLDIDRIDEVIEIRNTGYILKRLDSEESRPYFYDFEPVETNSRKLTKLEMELK